MIRTKYVPNLPVEVLAGGDLADMLFQPLMPYSKDAVSFLSDLSQRLLRDPASRLYPDIAGFAYWCRKANLNRLSKSFNNSGMRRLGRGVAFHIAPANVPVNFAFSFAFGLLSGNANIVRIPGVNHPQALLVCSVIADLFECPEHARIKQMTRIISYQREDWITETLSALSHARLLWGGDSTIKHLRAMPTSPRCVDVCFADRYSICVIDAQSVLGSSIVKMNDLVAGFYNDVFLLDQNACSSPHLILWQGTDSDIKLAKDKFWQAVQRYLQSKKNIATINLIDKYTHMCRTAINLDGCSVEQSNVIHRIWLENLPENIEDFRGKHGFFFESKDNELSNFELIVSERYQTVTYFGVDPDIIWDRICNVGLMGVDRVVPVGKALDISVVWDGYDLVSMLSRVLADD